MKFDSLDLHADILKGITDAGFERCTPVQEQSLPESLMGKDVISQSQTGSGKTAVFLITIYMKLLSSNGKVPKKPKALIMVPTRELALQVEQDARELGKHLPFRSVTIYGGVGYDKQLSALQKGVEIVVATPGRMIDLYKSKDLLLDAIEMFIIDEADRMFDMGFAPDISYIASRLPKSGERQTMLFSATIDENVNRLSNRFMKPELVTIEIEPEQVTVNSIDQKVCYVSNEEKLPALMALLNRDDAVRVIIFTNMKRTAEMVEWKLTRNGFPASVLTGDVSQSKRQSTIEGMKSGKLKILVATEVAARGLHIEDISHVINYDLPEEAASYVHRVGRTARAGKSGKAYSLVCEDHAFNLPEIEKYIEHKIESEWIEEAEMVEDKAGAFRGRKRTFGGPVKSDRTKRRPEKQGRKTAPPEKRKTDKDRKKETGPAPTAQKKKPSGKPAGKDTPKQENGKKRQKPASSKEDRIAYYKKKYGDDFGTKDKKGAVKDKKSERKGQVTSEGEEGIMKKVFKFFSKGS